MNRMDGHQGRPPARLGDHPAGPDRAGPAGTGARVVPQLRRAAARADPRVRQPAAHDLRADPDRRARRGRPVRRRAQPAPRVARPDRDQAGPRHRGRRPADGEVVARGGTPRRAAGLRAHDAGPAGAGGLRRRRDGARQPGRQRGRRRRGSRATTAGARRLGGGRTAAGRVAASRSWSATPARASRPSWRRRCSRTASPPRPRQEGERGHRAGAHPAGLPPPRRRGRGGQHAADGAMFTARMSVGQPGRCGPEGAR